MAKKSGSTDLIKYPNRRLYDPALSQYITLKDVEIRVKNGIPVRVVDRVTRANITRSVLLSVVVQMEEEGNIKINEEDVCKIIRQEPISA